MTLEPPDAEVQLTPNSIDLHGTGSVRTVTVKRPDQADPVTLVASLTGYKTSRYTWSPRPGRSDRHEVRLMRLPPDRSDEIVNSFGMELQLIPAGEFDMGNRLTAEELAVLFESNPEDFENEFPRHRVGITKPFYLGKHEVTVGQFRKFIDGSGYRTNAKTDGEGGFGWSEREATFIGRDPKYNWQETGFPQNDQHPVVNVSWNDAVAFCEWLTRKEGTRYRLPTEAEWEYACRAGTTSLFWHGDDPAELARIGNVADGTAKARFSDWTTITERDGYVFSAPVGQFQPNPFGLYDMHGNVWEWCQDWYDADYYANSAHTDPQGPLSGFSRLARGGSWGFYVRHARGCRSPCDRAGQSVRLPRISSRHGIGVT